MGYKSVILNKLLDKYEKSKSYNGESNRRIFIKARSLKEYDIESYEDKLVFHDEVEELFRKRIIEYSWEEFEKGNILNEIWLVKDNVDKAYNEIKRSDKKIEVEEILREISQYNFTEEWILSFISDIKEHCYEKKKESRLLPYKFSKDILTALYNLTPDEEVLKRVFSIKCFGDSKYFEKNIESYIISIVKKYLLKDYSDKITDEDVLREVGIVKLPEVIEFSGNLTATINGKDIFYYKDTMGSYINSYTVKNFSDIELYNVSKIIFIENKTNYVDYISNHQKEDEFTIYHGGVYSPVKGLFFKKIYSAAKDIEFFHWSDIDVGGLKIFTRLKEEIVPELKPYLMDIKDLKKMKGFWKDISDSYTKELENMLKMEKYCLFFETIKFMIRNRCRLEQESFIVSKIL